MCCKSLAAFLVPLLLLLLVLLVELALELALLDGPQLVLEVAGEVEAGPARHALDLDLHLARRRDGDFHLLHLRVLGHRGLLRLSRRRAPTRCARAHRPRAPPP